ncbi:4Fe-4S binding protein, partial [Thermoproteota archaeon]
MDGFFTKCPSTITSGKCTACGLCERVCPYNA